MDYTTIKDIFDLTNDLNARVDLLNEEPGLDRYTRTALYSVADDFSKAADGLSNLMDKRFSDHPDYRRWGIIEGWIDEARNPEEEALLAKVIAEEAGNEVEATQ